MANWEEGPFPQMKFNNHGQISTKDIGMNPKKYKLAASEGLFARIQLIDGSETLKSTY